MTSSVFRLLLLVVPVFFAITMVFSNPETVQGALKQSGAYDKIVDIVLDSSSEQNNDPTAKELLDDPEIRDIAKQAFSPDLLERSSNDFVQGIYDWLDGETEQLQFSVDLSSAKATLTDKLSSYAEERAASLPTCTIAQLQTVDLSGDLLNLPCLPPGITASQIGDQFSTQLLNDADVLDQPIITNQTIADQNDGKPITADAQKLPDAYQSVQTVKWILLGALIVLGLLLVFVRRDRRAGVRHVAWALVSVAAFLVIALLAYWFVFDKVSSETANKDVAQSLALEGSMYLLSNINTIIAWFTASYALIGIAALLFLRFRPAAPEPKIITDPSATLPKPSESPSKPKNTI